MATTTPLTTQEILDAVHIKYEQSTDTPTITDEDGIIRLNLLNRGIARWEYDNDTEWRELWTYNVAGLTIIAGQVAYPLTTLTGFRSIGSTIRLIRTDGATVLVNLVSQAVYSRDIATRQMTACITGNPSAGYQLNLGWVPVTNDGTIGAIPRFDYYKHATRMATMADIPEMSNPEFLISFITGELFATDNINLFSKHNGDAMNYLSNMRDENSAMGAYQSNAIEDQGIFTGGFGLGY